MPTKKAVAKKAKEESREERLERELRRVAADLRGRAAHGPPAVEWCQAQADYIDRVLEES